MAEIYIAFVDTPGIFATIIRKVLKQKYIHVAIGMDPYLSEAYSIGRRNPAIPIFAGFEKEKKNKISRVFPEADYMVCSFSCSEKQKEYIKTQLREAYQRRFFYHYTVIGLPFILLQRPFHQRNHYTCSSYIARLLEEAKVMTWNKDYSCVTPKDFFQRTDKKILFEGSLKELIEEEKKKEEKKNAKGKVSFENVISSGVLYGQ